MKSMNNKKNDEIEKNNKMSNSIISNNNNRWLGFSLSPIPNMKIESSSSSDPNSSSSSTTTSFFEVSPEQQLSDYGLDFGPLETVHSNACGFSSSLSVMPLNSDGSLCLMEALSTSLPHHHHQAMVTSCSSGPTPKLEDFFGSSTTQSLDNMLYTSYLSGLRPHEEEEEEQQQQQTMVLELPKEAHNNEMKSWVSRNNNFTVTESHEMIMGYGDLESLSLSMSPGPHWSSVTLSPTVVSTECGGANLVLETKKRGYEKVETKQVVHRKSLDTFGQRTSQYRGVTRHRWTGRYEAHLWDNSVKKEGQTRKGRQVYLGGYDMEDKAARAYDLAALKYWGPSTHINFPLDNYQKDLEEMKNMTRQEYVAHLRRKSSGFSRGASIYRGVTRHHQHGRWQARIGRVAGNKDLYLGTFSTQEEAAEAYDVAAIKFRGLNAVTNFDITRYDVDRIMTSNTLLAGELAKRNKIEDPIPANEKSIITSSRNMDSDSEIMMARKEVKESGKIENRPLSNASSLVTSLSNSREGSPDKSSIVPALFGMPPLVSKFFASSMTTTANSRVPLAQQRPSISMPHMPIFAAWTDI